MILSSCCSSSGGGSWTEARRGLGAAHIVSISGRQAQAVPDG